MDTDKLRTTLKEKLDTIRRELWYGGFQRVKSEPEYRHQIAVEKAWARYLSSIGCKIFKSPEILADPERMFNDKSLQGTVCVKIEEEFIFLPEDLAEKILVLGWPP